MILVGVYTAVVRTAAQPDGQREILLWVTMVDMAIFTALFAAALWFRRKPQLHKRLMTAAAVSLAIASVARMDFLPGPPAGPFVRFFLWSAPILIAIAHDARHTRRLHPVYGIALVMFAFRIWSGPVVMVTPQWTEVTARVLALVSE